MQSHAQVHAVYDKITKVVDPAELDRLKRQIDAQTQAHYWHVSQASFLLEHINRRIKEFESAPALAVAARLRPQVSALLDLVRVLKSFAKLQDIIVDTTAAWAKGQLTDHEAMLISELAHERKKELRQTDTVAIRAPSVVLKAISQGRQSHFPPKRKRRGVPDREASKDRRSLNALSGPLPPKLALRMTQGQLSVLNIVAEEIRTKGACRKTLDEIAARAGVCIATARTAIQEAARRGLLTIQERRRHLQANLSNVVRCISREWKNWMQRRKSAFTKGGGSKVLESTDTLVVRKTIGERLVGAQNVILGVLRPERPNPA